jgi:hypothetical protein
MSPAGEISGPRVGRVFACEHPAPASGESGPKAPWLLPGGGDNIPPYMSARIERSRQPDTIPLTEAGSHQSGC